MTDTIQVREQSLSFKRKPRSVPEHLLPLKYKIWRYADAPDPEQLATNWNFYVQGNRRASNNLTIDGATVNAIGNNFNSTVSVSMDTVAEVKVLVSNYQAEYGRMSGANISIVTKSGTKDFHGLASYFKRNEVLNANDFFNNTLGRARPRCLRCVQIQRYWAFAHLLGLYLSLKSKYT